jgi:membrane protease YdiL (CAAX protease family)
MLRKLIASFLVGGVPMLLMVWYRSRQPSGFVSVELIAYPLLFGTIGIGIVLLLKLYYLREPVRDLDAGQGDMRSDLLLGVALTVIYFVLFYVERLTLTDLLAFRSNEELLGLMLDMREQRWLLIVWFGPVLWVGVALYEELVRVFVLTTLWSLSTRRGWTVAVILIAAAMVGLTHWGQGPYGIVTIAIKSAVAGAFYGRYRRLFPLVVAHALYDGLQVGMLLLTYRR